MDLTTADVLYKQLFEAVQLGGLFPDSKTFVDCIPKESPSEIVYQYYEQSKKEDFDLKAFVDKYFIIPNRNDSDFISNLLDEPEDHIEKLWAVLERSADKEIEGDSLIALPYSYIVPGGRFSEIYYWDSYFTILGLAINGRRHQIERILDNFVYLVDQVGHIPNGNRTYFISRSQPPFFAQMIKLFADGDDPFVFRKYHDSLKREYKFWMGGERLVNVFGIKVNRYFDSKDAPREESYKEDVKLALESGRKKDKIYMHIRAACESGWDFSSRWFEDGLTLESINTLNIIPVDLNCLMYGMEELLLEMTEESAELEALNDQMDQRLEFLELAWNPEKGIYEDFDLKKETRTQISSLATMFPLFFKMVPQEKADLVADFVRTHFLKPGGLLTTINNTGQQWDAPNGWAPLQWIAVKALDNYGHKDLARIIATRWTDLNDKVFKETGKFVEKYNVEDIGLTAGGGEYPVQDGFGWTNGVYLAMKEYLKQTDDSAYFKS